LVCFRRVRILRDCNLLYNNIQVLYKIIPVGCARLG